MIKKGIIFIICVLAISVLSCAIPNQAPTVFIAPAQAQAAIDMPKDGEVIPFAPYEIVYHGSDLTEVSQLELGINSLPVTIQSNPAPGTGFVLMRFIWTPPAPGSYILQTRAQNQKGEWGPYSYITITVETPTAQPTTEIIGVPTRSVTKTSSSYALTPTFHFSFGDAFTSVSKSTNKIFYGADNCGVKSVNFAITVDNPKGVQHVYIFVRLDDKASDDKTSWDDGKSMTAQNSNSFTVTINSTTDIPNHTIYPEAWLGYQFVIEQPDGEYVRSDVISDVTLAKCP